MIKILHYISAVFLLLSCTRIPDTYVEIESEAEIFPDYTNITIPKNICPINFMVLDNSDSYFVRIISENKSILIKSEKNKIYIPEKKWKRFLQSSAGKDFSIEIYAKDGTNWIQYPVIHNTVANSSIDSYLVYRLLTPGFELWSKLGIYQRNIESFEEDKVLHNELTNASCMNCHVFNFNNPNQMALQLRAPTLMLVASYDSVKAVNTKTPFNSAAAAYSYWHPSGRFITSSVNKIKQYFHSHRDEIREVFDLASDLICYDIDKNLVFTDTLISQLGYRETFPAWSPDGQYLYFSSAPSLKNKYTGYDSVKYDLKRVFFDTLTNRFSKLETIISSADVGHSIVMPRISPDGRYAVVTFTDHGSFPIHERDADLYIIDLQTMAHSKMSINSEFTDSYHTWSSNSEWMVFSSKRNDPQTARPYFTFINDEGECSKPFVLPQKDPDFYNSFLITYNVPELIKSKVNFNPIELGKTALGIPVQAILSEDVSIDGRSGETIVVGDDGFIP